MSSTRPSNAGALQHSQPQVVNNNITYNTSIYGGRGGSGGQGGNQGGSGGTGEGPTIHQNFPSSNVLQASPLLNHCPPPSRIFHGRRTILDTMHQFFAQETGKQKIYVLYGLGGAGKTQIALKFIKEWTHFKDQLFFFPKCNHSNIIITSRNPTLRGYGANSQVSDMNELDAVELLLKSAQHEVSEPNKLLALDIVKALWYLPLAIVQAGAFILECGTLHAYLDLFMKNRTELLKKKSAQNHDDYAWAVYTTWEMSFHRLSPPAAVFLQLCSFLYRDDIFEEIFSKAANHLWKSLNHRQTKPKRLQKIKLKFMRGLHLSRSQFESSAEVEITKARDFLSYFVGPTGDWDSLSFLTVTNEIQSYSLINFDPEKKSFSIHPLVHSWSRTTLDNLDSYHLSMEDILGMSVEEIPYHDLQLASLRLVSHVDFLMQVNSKLNAKFQWSYGKIYYHARRYTEAEQLGIMEVEKWRKCLGDDDSKTLLAMHQLAMTYAEQSRYEDAQKLQVVVLEKWTELLGDDHLDTLHAMNNLANTYASLGRSEECERLEVVVLEKRRKFLGDDHLDTLHSMYNVAITYNSQGRYEEAEKLNIVVLEKQRKALGDDHLDTLKARSNLAYTYAGMGRFEEAEKLQVGVLEKTKKIIGADHLETLMVMAQLGYTCYSLGRFEEAEKLQVAALEKRRKVLGDDHLDTLDVMNNLANTYNSLSRFEETEKLQVVLLEKRKKVFGDDHSDTLLVMQSLGTTYNRLGRLEEAESCKLLCWKSKERFLVVTLCTPCLLWRFLQ
ncbi:hypothetical protein C8R45DRAFT_1164627 [Mycena sanguinolenta]|nr:hypothetical protein C8R45DRAFT_1164627 [Mycena sanguinolenta]